MKREIRANDREKLAQEIAGLTGLSIKELKDRWRGYAAKELIHLPL